jgi:N-acetylneuraminate synthase
MGSHAKVVSENERDTVVVQRRCLRAAQSLQKGTVLRAEMLEVLRPAPPDSVKPFDLQMVVGKRLTCSLAKGDHLRWTILADSEACQ